MCRYVDWCRGQGLIPLGHDDINPIAQPELKKCQHRRIHTMTVYILPRFANGLEGSALPIYKSGEKPSKERWRHEKIQQESLYYV